MLAMIPRRLPLVTAAALFLSMIPTYAQTIAYDAPAVQPGNQNFTGNLGLDFDVSQPIVIQALGAFDSNGDGITGPVQVAIFNRDTTSQVTPAVTFAGNGTLVNEDRFLPLVPAVVLGPGHYSVVAVGFGAADLNGNSGCVGNAAASCFGGNTFKLSKENGDGLITFVGSGRFDGNATLDYPTTVDGGPSNRYLAGTFQFIAFQAEVGYAANLSAGQSVIDLTNTGATGGNDSTDFICADVYVFAQDQQLISCCACQLSPNDLQTLSVQADLISNTLTPGVPTGVTTMLLASTGTCDAASVTPTTLTTGLRAWGTTLHAAPGGKFAVTENAFSDVTLSTSELTKMTQLCGFIESNGSGFGICNTCTSGAAGASKR
jgi:hypothetical protein